MVSSGGSLNARFGIPGNSNELEVYQFLGPRALPDRNWPIFLAGFCCPSRLDEETKQGIQGIRGNRVMTVGAPSASFAPSIRFDCGNPWWWFRRTSGIDAT